LVGSPVGGSACWYVGTRPRQGVVGMVVCVCEFR